MSQVNYLSKVGKWSNPTHIGQLYINGEWVDPSENRTIPVINPAMGETIAEVGLASQKDVQSAILAARQAFDDGVWRSTSPHKRAKLLSKLASKIEDDLNNLAEIETVNNGKTLREAKGDVEEAVKTFRYYAGLATKPTGETFEAEEPFVARVVREPIGVCGQIIPWNYPLLMAAWKLAPALAAGNTCILKPSEITPLTAIRLFELIDEVGFPKGVVNLVNGTGVEAGQPLVESTLVDKIAFTGGTATGKTILEKSVGNLKRVSLELGGKSPNIIFADADYESALDYATFAIFNNAGQVCSAGSRLLVDQKIYDQFIKDLVEVTKKIRVGNGLDPSSEMGSLVSEQQLTKIKNYIEIGKTEGAKLVCGGNRLRTNGLEDGFFIEPTIFVDVKPKSRIAQEEIFGPVLCIIPFETEEEAINIANDSPFGLAAGIFTSDVSKAERVAKAIRAGVTWINTYEQNLIEGPWGGYKESGIGRELGIYGFNEYTEVKQIINTLKVEPTGWFSS
ncbi:aldehyde dehydrogenase family protein [Sporosarcina sp. HYO08]|uniref:aldehyde dehydrogenase family protein n=1 Tax=Sporosarcina sp. HYO08 TaxID=1759557 RepID=UPI00079B5B9E|nr:aldehyde dehydrogenase family protein [Sporosarcina sp. HYO08]KXH83789.1 betaine-aldehyde dehydrogenase [Sporosarcina sp. HYO08]